MVKKRGTTRKAAVEAVAVERVKAPHVTIEYGNWRVSALLADTDAAKRLSVLHAFDALARAAAWSAVENRGPESWIAQLGRSDIRADLLHVERIEG